MKYLDFKRPAFSLSVALLFSLSTLSQSGAENLTPEITSNSKVVSGKPYFDCKEALTAFEDGISLEEFYSKKFLAADFKLEIPHFFLRYLSGIILVKYN